MPLPTFNAKDGLSFRRNDNGSVAVIYSAGITGQDDQEIILDANTWASAILAVSKAEDSNEHHGIILAMHNNGFSDCV